MAKKQKVTVVRNYKDTVFRMIFREAENLLGLYNAVNKTHYTNVKDLRIVTLENAVYLSMKNDISCILDMRLQLYEQQSSYNPNMPLRCLMYLSAEYEKLTTGKDIYGSRIVKLPTPRFFVFYNGVSKQPERKLLKLTEAFEIQEEDPALELKVLQLNLNDGYNQELKEACPKLLEYMIFVDKVRSFLKDKRLEEAVQKAVDECIQENVLKEFLLSNKAEVIRMTIYEYDEELHNKTIREESYEEGYSAGEKTGYDNGYSSGEKTGYDNGYSSGVKTGYNNGVKTGYDSGIQEMILNMYENDIPKEVIARVAKVSIEDIEQVIKNIPQ